jgi:mannose-6-phosphate isomerase
MIATISKVWGYEEWIVNRKYCGKFLHLKKGWQCSLHYHERKDETFYVMSGLVYLERDHEAFELKPGAILHIPPGAIHRFAGLEDSVILEISTHDDDDNLRIEPSGEMKRAP